MASFGGETTSGNVAASMGGPGDHAACDAGIVRLRHRAEAAEAKEAEVRQAVTTFRDHYAATLGDQASDVITAVLQVLDRVPLPGVA